MAVGRISGMILAAAKGAAKVAAEPHWWADWPKFLPGWLAFVITVGTLIHKWWTRRHKVALGLAADDLRTQLIDMRSLLEEVTSGGKDSNWFLNEERKEAARKLRDSADRTEDAVLRQHVVEVADAWDEAFALSSPSRPRVRWLGSDGSPADRNKEAEMARVEGLGRLQKMTDVARDALPSVKAALDRLNALEKRTIG